MAKEFKYLTLAPMRYVGVKFERVGAVVIMVAIGYLNIWIYLSLYLGAST